MMINDEKDYYWLIVDGNIKGLQIALERHPEGYKSMPYGQSLTLLAVFEGKTDILEFLITHGIDVNKGDVNNYTPLHAAAEKNNYAMAETLIAAGARVDDQDNYGNTPLFKAVYSCQGDSKVITLLLRHGACPLRKNSSGVSPRDLAETMSKDYVLDIFDKPASKDA